MTADLLLGLDLGTTRCKAVLLDAAGAEQCLSIVATPFSQGQSAQGQSAGIEMTLEALFNVVAELLRPLKKDLPRVAGIGIAGMAECGAPVDPSTSALAPIIAWHDPRGGGVAERLDARFGDDLALRTGNRARSVSTVAKLGWLVRHGTTGVDGWLGVPELCHWHLTGVRATEHSLASRTGCYGVLTKTWLSDVATAAGFSTDVFPPVRPAGSVMGEVTAEAAKRHGLPSGTPVTLAGHDHLAGAAGAGAGSGDLVNSVGTAECVLGPSPAAPDLKRALRLRTPVSVAPGGAGWVVLGGSARAGVLLAAVSSLLGSTPQDLDAAATDAPAGFDARPLIEALQDGGGVEPPSASPGAVWRGVLDALAQRTAETAERVAAMVLPSRMLVIGGGATSAPWMRAKAQRVALPLARPRTGQAAARGAALFAGVAAGWWATVADAPTVPADPVPAGQA